MPDKCSAPNCTGNYDSNPERVSVFRFPSDPTESNKWVHAIHRADWQPTPKSVLCEKHFSKEDVIRVDKFKFSDGSTLELPRIKPRLREGAVPIYLPGLPAYLSKEALLSRTDPKERKLKSIARQEAENERFLQSDRIINYNDFLSNFKKRLVKDDTTWQFYNCESCVVIYKLDVSGVPSIPVSIKVDANMKLSVFVDNSSVSLSKLAWILDKHGHLKLWSQIDNILARYNDMLNKSEEPQLDSHVHMSDAISNLEVARHKLSDENAKLVTQFLIEQIKLALVKNDRGRRFPSYVLKLAFMIFTNSPSTYELIRDSNCIILPHRNVLKKLSSPLQVEPGMDCGRIKCGSKAFSEIISRSSSCLHSGGVIAVPTDTIYGIACLSQNTEAVNRIYEIKNRNFQNPVAISVGHIDDIYKWGKVIVSREVLTDLLPGPVTVVFERTPDLNPALNPHTHLVGIRIPDHSFIQSLARHCDSPIALTSANVSGATSCLSVKEFENLWSKLDFVVNGGKLSDTEESRRGSTVVDLSLAGSFRIIRPGSAYESTVTCLRDKHKLQDVSSLCETR